MSRTKVWINSDLYEKVKEIAEKSNRSITDLVNEAVSLFILGREQFADKEIKSVKQNFIVTQYETKCRICKKKIPQGEMVFWVKYVFEDNTSKSYVICLDCYYSKYDKAFAKRYLKLKELEAVKKGLEKEIKELITEYNELKKKKEFLVKEIDLLKIKEDLLNLYKEFNSAFKYFLSPNADKDNVFKKINDIMEKMMDLTDKVSEIEAYIKSSITVEVENKEIEEEDKKVKVRRWVRA